MRQPNFDIPNLDGVIKCVEEKYLRNSKPTGPQLSLTKLLECLCTITLEDLAKGSFVCEYVWQILTNTRLHERNVNNNVNDRHTYPVLLDADWGSEAGLKDEDALCLDATHNGNVV